MATESPYTILDNIVQDTFRVIGQINDDHIFDDRHVVIAGGMASQLYNDPQLEDLLRPSMDIDCATYPSLSNTEYDNIHSYISSGLNSKGYKCKEFPKKQHRNIGTICSDNNYLDTLVIHFDRFSKSYFEKVGPLEKKKVEDAMVEPLYFKGISVHVVKPEQIWNGKMKTLVHQIGDIQSNTLKKIFHYAATLNFSELSKIKLSNWLNELIEIKSTIVSAQTHDRLVDADVVRDYKLSKNLYDLCLLSRNVEIGHINFDIEEYFAIRQQTNKVFSKSEDPFTELYFTP